MSSSENSKPPPTLRELQASLAKGLIAMNPKDRDLLLRLERARRGLPIARTSPGGQGLADLIAAVPDDQVAAVAARAGIETKGRTPPQLRTSLLLWHEDQVREALAGAIRSDIASPPPPPEEIHTGGPHRYSTYSPPQPYGSEPVEQVTVGRQSSQQLENATRTPLGSSLPEAASADTAIGPMAGNGTKRAAAVPHNEQGSSSAARFMSTSMRVGLAALVVVGGGIWLGTRGPTQRDIERDIEHMQWMQQQLRADDRAAFIDCLRDTDPAMARACMDMARMTRDMGASTIEHLQRGIDKQRARLQAMQERQP